MNETTCQICGRPVKAKANGRIAHHGYRRPGSGWQTASCHGTGAAPYEMASDRIVSELAGLAEAIVKTEALLADLVANPPAVIVAYVKGRSAWDYPTRVEYARPDDFTPAAYDSIPRTYANEYGNKRREFARNIEACKNEIQYLEKRLADWKPAAE